ncbi:Isochorismatase [Paraburkholderia tropica]|uniref:cysteine hydrolase family protein n=1 Tax=Paraburkholderia tropica TaxID=92647 RepID=UPI001CB65447|nr:isochorismatase family cysteine hydrolase [Paraburkholderia tropica]CAG9228433.1 Isochorismatase [Paraburkholderia tropica]
MSKQLHIDPAKSALLVMDYQNILLENYVPDAGRAALLANAASLIAAARAARMSVIYVMVAFRPGHPEVSPRNTIFSFVKENGLFLRDQPGTAIHSDVAPLDGETVILKQRVGAFGGTDLQTVLRSSGVETLVLTGITTGGVVLSTVRQAFDLDYRLLVARDCCADPDSDVQEVLLDKIIAQHAEVVSAQQVIDAMSA